MKKDNLTFAELIRVIKTEVEHFGIMVLSDALTDISLLWESSKRVKEFSYIWCIFDICTHFDYDGDGNIPSSLKNRIKARYQIKLKRGKWSIESL